MPNRIQEADPCLPAASSTGVRAASRLSRKHINIIILVQWIGAAIALVCLAHSGPVGWDAGVYWKAAQSLQRGGDPYTEGIAEQQAFHNLPVHHLNEHTPFTYVYSPLTLPLLRPLAKIPATFLASVYGCFLVAGFLLQLWAGFQMAVEKERLPLKFLLPAVAFFPGLLCSEVILSGNAAYLLYGIIFAAAVPGWKRDRWSWFYIAVLAASVFKAPFLTLLAFPLLVGRRQWIPAGITGALGLLLFAAPSRIWPNLFREYLRAVYLQFEWNYDFGFAPSGVLGTALHRLAIPYNSASTLCYVIFAAAIGLLLVGMARRVRQGRLSREAWIPIALVGTILMNPRIKEYDIAAITVPMLLISWRVLRCFLTPASTGNAGSDTAKRHSGWTLVIAAAGCFLAVNFLTGLSFPSWAADVLPSEWRCVAGLLLLGIFAGGVWTLLKETKTHCPEASNHFGAS